MKSQFQSLAARVLPITFCGTLIVACGGGADSPELSLASSESSTAAKIVAGRGNTPTTPPTNTPSSPVKNPGVAAITKVRLENIGKAVAQTNVPVTFGQVFAPGHLSKDSTLTGRLENGQSLPLQVDVKASHPDGSVRHAIISAIVPSLAAGQTATLELVSSTGGKPSTGASTAQLIASGFTASVTATYGGVRYQASADELIKAGKATSWLTGATVNEWHVSAPLKTSAGAAHPHLSARFAVRWYGSVQKARVDVVVENNWAYEAAPQNFTYDAQVLVGGQPVLTQAGLTHLHHARWRKVFWQNGATPSVNVKHDTAYLIASRALPNYDQSLTIQETTLAAQYKRWNAAGKGPMQIGMATSYMPQTGGREDIGLLPTWGALHLLSMDQRTREMNLGTADLAGSWSMHYRDRNTGQPISLIDYPYMTIAGRSTDTRNPATGKYEAFPTCADATACKTPYTHDIPHQPSFAYLPYLVTGDHYYLEELQFWGMYDVFNSNPGYREHAKGLLKSEQVRGQAWGLRTLAEAAYITPDADRLKSHFESILDSNLEWYNQNYAQNASANQLGIIANGYWDMYDSGTAIAPWMDDFFTSAVGHAAELGYTKAQTLLKWKTKFATARIIGEGTCYISGAMYNMKVRDSKTSPLYTSMAQVYKSSTASAPLQGVQCASAEMASKLKLKVGEMTGYSDATAGYPSNMQPALAYAADVSGAEGKKAWTIFMSRSVKPDYSTAPQFDIVPR